MRAPVIGFLPTIHDVTARTAVQCVITHNTEDGLAAAIAASLTAHFCIYSLGHKEDIFDFLQEYVPDKVKRWKGEVGSPGLESVSAAVTAFSRNDKLSELLLDCVNFIGDVDTVAAIALACASESEEYEKDLPEILLANLEPFGKYGQDFLSQLDWALKTFVRSK